MWIFMLPYALLVFVYIFAFGVHLPTPPPGNVKSAIFKCLPIVYLLLLLRIAPKVSEKHDNYRMCMSIGFLFSLGGDWFLNWSTIGSYFVPGLGFFAFAQLSYIFAFGFSPVGTQTAFTFTVAALITMKILVPDVRPKNFRPLVVMYIVLLGIMGWRATARYKEARSIDTWLAMAGAVFFIISDFTIGYKRWKQTFARSMLFIMATYYMAQMLFTASVLFPSWEAIQRFKAFGV